MTGTTDDPGAPLPPPLDALSPGQVAVLALVAQYKSSKEIARTLGISPNTVDQRLKRVQAILGVGGRFEAARLYMAALHDAESQAPALWGDLVYQPSDLSVPADDATVAASPGKENRPVGEPLFAHQAQAAYADGFMRWDDRRPWYAVLLEAGRTNELSTLARALCIGGITLAAVLSLAAAVSLTEGLSRIF